MGSDLKSELVTFLKHWGAYDVRVADPRSGFEHGIPGRRPSDLWDDCRSVVVFAIAKAPALNDTYIGPKRSQPDPQRLGRVPMFLVEPEYALRRLGDYIVNAVQSEGEQFLRDRGHQVFRASSLNFQMKLAAYEAGLGVYGKSGILIHPELGNRMQLSAIMTDTEMEPDGKLIGLDPCANCQACIRACPVEAFDASKLYPHSFDANKCEAKRKQIGEEQSIFCNRCWSVCPAGHVSDRDLLHSATAKLYTGHNADN